MGKRRVVTAVVCLLATISALGVSAPAVSATAPVLQGRVTDVFSGAPVAAVNVRVWVVGASNFLVSTTTDATGSYSVATLAPGNYQVQFAKSGAYATRWWNGQDQRGTATTVVIDSSGATHQADSTLVPTNSLSGMVTQASGPVVGATVKVYIANTSTVAGTTATSSTGAWQFGPPFAAGSYQVLASAPGYVSEWYGQVTTQSASPVVVVTTTSNVTASITLAPVPVSGSLAGSAVDSVTQRAVSGATVQVYPAGSTTPAGSATTGSGGTWSVAGLTPGSYQILYTDSRYVSQWYLNSTTQSGATAVSVTTGTQTPTSAVSLAPSPSLGALTGVVTDASTSATITGASVTVYPVGSSSSTATVLSNSTGQWTVTVLPPGTYQVVVASSGRVTQWYLNSATQAGSTPVTVSAGTTTSVPVALATAVTTGTVNGTVTDAYTSAAISGASVQIYPTGSTSVAASTTAAADGSWSIAGLVPGSYQEFVSATNYHSLWYVNAATQAAATSITVTSGGVIAAPVALSVLTGSLQGTLTDSWTSAPLAGTVTIYRPNFTIVASSATDSQGNWTVSGLAVGSYYVMATASSYNDVYYPNSPDRSGAVLVTVSAGLVTPLGTFAVPPETATLQGTVTDTSTSAPIAGVSVQVWRDTGSSPVATLTTDAGGNWSLLVEVASYQVMASAPGYDPLWYVHASTRSQATFVFGNNGDIKNVPIALTPIDQFGTLQGTVTNTATTAPVSGATVSVYAAGTTTAYATLTTAADGSWLVANVPDGQYQVQVAANGYITQWYVNSPNQAGSTSVAVLSGATAPVPVALTAVPGPGSLTGTVVDSVTAAPLAGATIWVYTPGSSSPIKSTTTSSSGTWTVPNLAAGTYLLQINDYGYVTQWYLNASTESGATPVTVAAGAATNVVVPMVLNGSLRGVLTDASTGAPVLNARIYAYPTGSPDVYSQGGTSTGGVWTLPYLPAGSYQLQVVAPNYLTQWYVNASVQTGATPLSVTYNTVTEADMTLVPVPTTGVIQGTVTDASSSAAIVGATVKVYPSGSTTVAASTTTGSGGAWSVAGLAPGSYQVSFSSTSYLPAWYQNAATQATATSVTVTAGGTAAIPMSLTSSATTATVSGRMTDATTGNGIKGGFVRFYLKGAQTFTSFTTAADGSYTATLPAGVYEISFSEPSHTTLWWHGATARGTDTPVTLAGGSVTTISMALTPK